MIGLLVEEIAELTISFCFPGTQDAIDLENLLGLREAKANVSVVQDIDKEVGMQAVKHLYRRWLGI